RPAPYPVSASAPPSFAILGTGSYAPARIVTNDELSKTVDTSDEWIHTRTGIRERRLAGPEDTTASMAVASARAALADAGLAPSDIDLLIVATLTPDQPMPATACLVQTELGLPPEAACFDLNAACTGFVYALDTAWALLASGRHRHALVIGAEKLSSVVDWTDRTTCVLFGDGAGAVILGPAPADSPTSGLLDAKIGAARRQDWRAARHRRPAPDSRHPQRCPRRRSPRLHHHEGQRGVQVRGSRHG
nr:beta-ketoacyl-ACP synthase 3 [Opitutaceae bacterium]